MATNQQEISILLAFGRTILGELSEQAFKRQPSFHVVARANTIDDVLEVVRSKKIDVALITSALKDGPLSGILALQRIRESSPSVKSVILLENSEDNLVTTGFRAGAMGVFFPVQDSFRSLCRCVKQVNVGQIWANSAQLREVLETFARHAPVRVVNTSGVQLLTEREEEIVRLVADGLTNRQIAKDLELSEHTIRNNLFRVFDKLGVSTRVELALYVINQAKLVRAEEPHARKKSNRVRLPPVLPHI